LIRGSVLNNAEKGNRTQFAKFLHSANNTRSA
jgi:hypothetical protein